MNALMLDSGLWSGLATVHSTCWWSNAHFKPAATHEPTRTGRFSPKKKNERKETVAFRPGIFSTYALVSVLSSFFSFYYIIGMMKRRRGIYALLHFTTSSFDWVRAKSSTNALHVQYKGNLAVGSPHTPCFCPLQWRRGEPSASGTPRSCRTGDSFILIWSSMTTSLRQRPLRTVQNLVLKK